MSYHPTRRPRALSGIQSRPSGMRISRSALGDITEYGTLASQPPVIKKPAPRVRYMPVGRAPAWYSEMQGATLGDDTTLTDTPPTGNDQAVIQAQILADLNRGISELKLQRWLQIIATLSIPLAAQLWKMILRKRGAATPTP